MRILVTGGFGFMGAWAVQHLLSAGHDVFVLSRSAVGKSYTDTLERQPEFVQADLAVESAHSIAERLPGYLHACIHTASLNDMAVPDYGQKALHANVCGTRNLLEAFRIRGLCAGGSDAPKGPWGNGILVQYPSTFHVYGKASGHIDEHTPVAPASDYAITHYLAEEYCRYYTRIHGIPSVVLRCTNGYGAPKCQPFGKWQLLFHDLCKMAYEQGTLTLKSPPDTKRDFIWMGDICRTMESLLHCPEVAGQTFCVAHGTPLSIGDMAQSIADEAHIFRSQLGQSDPVSVRSSAPATHTNTHLSVSNAAVTAATGLVFSNRIREEARLTLTALAAAKGKASQI